MDEDLQAMAGRKGVSGPFSPLEGFAWELKLLLGLSSAQLHKHHLWSRYKKAAHSGDTRRARIQGRTDFSSGAQEGFFCSGERARSEEAVSVCADCGVFSRG